MASFVFGGERLRLGARGLASESNRGQERFQEPHFTFYDYLWYIIGMDYPHIVPTCKYRSRLCFECYFQHTLSTTGLPNA
jgi:hypothetical protein